MKKRMLFLLTWALSVNGYARDLDAAEAMNGLGNRFFIENKGQWHSDVLYLCRMGGLDAWITRYGVNYTFYRIENAPRTHTGKAIHSPPVEMAPENIEKRILYGHRVLMKFKHPNQNAAREGIDRQQGYYNYFIGNDPDKHVRYVGLYKEAAIRDVYQGIDLRYYFDQGSLRFDFIVHPGADPGQIEFSFTGQNDAYLKDGNLCFTTRFGEVSLIGLHIYQGETTIPGAFVKAGNTWKLAVGNYDKSKELIIDPLIYSTFIGGGSTDIALDMAVDEYGYVYVTGFTDSTDYDTTAGAFQTVFGGGYSDVFVTKLNPAGNALVYSTYLGGSAQDQGWAIAIDNNGNAYITGRTSSFDFPITPGAYQTSYVWFSDVFVTKLNATGSALVYSTYLGGIDIDESYDIDVDSGGNAYVTGFTQSNDFPVTAGAFQTTYGGGYRDVFVTKLNATGNALVYSTYLGGNQADIGYGIAVDKGGNAFITGHTYSSDYDITAGAFQTISGGSMDVFVTKLNATGDGLVYSTYIGGSDWDEGRNIAIDTAGNAWITGYTMSTNFDVTPGAYQRWNAGDRDAFVTKLNATGNALLYSTYIGGYDWDMGYGIAVDAGGFAYIIGNTYSRDYPTTAKAYQTAFGGGSIDIFITKLNPTGNALSYSTFLGGNDYESGIAIHIDSSGNVYLAGGTSSFDYPVTPGAYQTAFTGGNNDVIVTKLCLDTTMDVSLITAQTTTEQTVCVNNAISGIEYTTNGATGVIFSGLPPGVTGTWTNDTIRISGTPAVADTFHYTVSVQGNCGYIVRSGTITVISANTVTLISPNGTTHQTVCVNQSIANIIYVTSGITDVTISGLPAGVTGRWIFNRVVISGTPTVAGTFNYTISLTGLCSNLTETGTITVIPQNSITLTPAGGADSQTVCINDPIADIIYTTTGATGVTFSGMPPGVTGVWSNDTVRISGVPAATGTYQYTIATTGGCGFASVTGTIKVELPDTITFIAAGGADSQTVCINDPIADIIYTTTGATGAAFSGLPPGVTGIWSNDTVRISGVPSAVGTFQYTVTTTGGCNNATDTGTITVEACTGIHPFGGNPADWTVHPNPNRGWFTIRPDKPAVFELTDITGKIINRYTVKQNNLRVKAHLAAGVYFIREKESGTVQPLVVE